MAKTPAIPEPPAPVALTADQMAVRDDFQNLITEHALWADTSGLIAKILNAESFDAACKVYNATPADAINGVPLEIRGVHFLPSAFDGVGEGILGAFALLDVVVLSSGEVLTVSCGGESVMASLLGAAARGELPVKAKIFKGERTARGFNPWNIEPLVGTDF